jgi:exopolysaccharide biosynthesis predicted pyruvyltransferase EpsI
MNQQSVDEARATPTPHEVLIATLREKIDLTLRPLLSGIRSTALVGFPSYSNVGDSAIWLGQLAYLRSLEEVTLTYSCDAHSYSRGELAKRLGDGTILLSGGGNLGDLWEAPQALRERVIRDFPHTRIVQLPQSVHFRDRHALQRARDVFSSHPALTLLVRDRQSLAFAAEELRTPSHLCPDMAFCLGPIERPCLPTKDLIWLSRTDKEAPNAADAPRALDIERVDWLAEPVTTIDGLMSFLDRYVLRYAHVASGLDGARSRVWEQLARRRLSRGCRLLAAGRTVLTDRLHGHILSVLLGIPHLLLDNSTGKVRSFYDTWTHALPLVRWCQTPTVALALARSGAPEASMSHRREA